MLFQIKLNFFIIIVICCLGKVSVINLCEDPDPVVNSYRFKDDSDFLQEGGWLNYTCYLNHEAISGSLNRQCQGGQYSGDPPVCIYTCGPAPNITDMLTDIPVFSVDGTVLNYTCKYDNNIKMEAICSKLLNAWIYNYTVCPHPTNLMDNERMYFPGLDTKFYDNDTNTCGTSGYGFSQEFGGGLVDATHIALIFGLLGPVMGPITVALNGTTNPCNGSWTNPVSNGSFNVSCPPGTYGSILAISSNNSFTLCEVHVTGNYRNGQCPGRTSFEKYAEVVSRDDTGITLGCIPGYYHQKGVNVVKCQEDLTWEQVYIKCSPERQLVKMVSNNSRLTDLDVNTCVMLSTGAIDLLLQPSLGGKIVLSYVSVHLKADTPGPDININVTGLSGDPTVKQRPIRTLTGGGQLKQFPFKYYPEGDGVMISVDVPSTQTVNICEVYVYADRKDNKHECFQRFSCDYQGKLNFTRCGKVCDRWDGVPANIWTDFSRLPDNSVTQAENYCRDPDNTLLTPWCFTDNYSNTEPCMIFKCQSKCALSDDGLLFSGFLRQGLNNDSCVPWQDVIDSDKVPVDVAKEDPTFTHCRNYGLYSSPWCFTNITGTSFTKCDIIHCPKTIQYKYMDWSTVPIGTFYKRCFWEDIYQITEVINRGRVTDLTKTFNAACSDNVTHLYCFGDDDYILYHFHLESCVPKITSTELSTTELTATTDPSTITLAATTDHSTITPAASTAITNALTPTDHASITTAASTTTTTTTTTTRVSHLTTTTEPTTELNATDTCGCRCFTFSLRLLDDETTEEKISNITKFLSINKNSLSSKIRKQTSANDTRPSATYVGSFAIILFCIFFCLLVLPDLLKLLYHLKVMLKYGDINNIPYHK